MADHTPGNGQPEERVLEGPDRDSTPAISVRNLTKRFGPHSVLTGTNLDIAEGEMLVVLGPSGSGKTTLLRIIAGLERPDSGEIFLKGKPATGMSPQARRLGVVFQEQALFQRMTVAENIAFGLTIRKTPAGETRDKVDSLLGLTRLQAHRNKLPSQLSGGQRQRVAVARAMAFKPEAMLFDEPFSALDAVTRTELRREVRTILKSIRMPAFFITHDQEEALELADRVAVLNEGRIEQIGTPFDVYNMPRNEFVATFLGAANVLLGRWRAGQVAIASLRLRPVDGELGFTDGQPLKIVFRPEDVVLNLQQQLLETPFYLGAGVIDDISYIGPTERLAVRLLFMPARPSAPRPDDEPSFSDGFPVTVTRTKWDAADMELSVGDSVVIGLKGFRLLPHYPLGSETGAKVYT